MRGAAGHRIGAGPQHKSPGGSPAGVCAGVSGTISCLTQTFAMLQVLDSSAVISVSSPLYLTHALGMEAVTAPAVVIMGTPRYTHTPPAGPGRRLSMRGD